MNANADSRMLTCPYCGSTQMIVENDTVTIERIRKQTELERQQAWKDVELTKLQHEKEKAQNQQQRETIQEFKKSKFRIFILIFLLFCVGSCITSFSEGYLIRGFISLVQSILLTIAWLLGMQIIKGKKPIVHILLSAIALLLIIPYLKIDDYVSKNTTYIWPSSGIGLMLPQPESDKGEINYDSAKYFSLDVYGVSAEQYQKYLSACKDRGFTLESEVISESFYANNAEGYRLSLRYSSETKDLSIHLDAPKVEEEATATIESDAAVIVPNDASQPVDSENFPETAVPTNSPVEPTAVPIIANIPTALPTESLEMIDGMRKEFKEAMDSFEAFFDQYVAFMQKYKSAPTDLSLLADYAKFMAQYTDMMQKMDAWDDGTLSNAELSYYIAVTSRISQKLLTVAQ